MEMISSKIALTLTGSGWKWLHEEAWTDKHRIFANKCRSFANFGINKVTWLSLGKKGHPPEAIVGQKRVAKWLLVDINTDEVWSTAQLFWEDGTFEQGWLSIATTLKKPDFKYVNDPINWLIESIMSRLRPDLISISGDLPATFESLFESVNYIAPSSPTHVERGKFFRLSQITWRNYEGSNAPSNDLDWIRKRSDREQREAEKLTQPRKSHFLVRVLLSMNPFRRIKREKMIHPLTKYRARL